MENSDLFPSLPLPKILVGESLYSWCARFHLLSCNTSARKTSLQLFGHPSSGLRPDFPTPIKTLLEKTEGQLGNLDDLVTQGTLYGFYRPFLPEARAISLKDAVENGNHRMVHQILGMAANQPQQFGLLKYCPACNQENNIHSPYSFWLTEHQWPAMLICLRHQQPLLSANNSVTEQSLRSWVLPSKVEDQVAWRNVPPVHRKMLSRMKEISAWCYCFASSSDITLDTLQLRYTYLLEAKDKGYIAMDGSLRLALLRDAFRRWLGSCVEWPALSFAQGTGGANAGFIGQLIRQYPGIRHPLKHILLISYLFPIVETFFERYKEVTTIHSTNGEYGLKCRLSNTRDKLANLVIERRQSLNSAAADLGISVTQAAKFLNKANIPYQHRPRIVGTEQEIALREALLAGKDRTEICREFGLRNGFIKDYLARHLDIKEQWKKARQEKIICKYRENFLNLLHTHSGVPIKKLKQIPQNGIQWLQRHDRKWLENNLPILSSIR